MQYRINNSYTLFDLDDAVEEIVNNLSEAEFDDYINDSEPDVEICNCTFDPADVLQRMAPGDYRAMFSDWADSERDDIRYELACLDGGDSENIRGSDVKAVREDEDNAFSWHIWYVEPGRPDLLEDVFDDEDAANNAAEALNTGFDRVDPMPEGARYEVRPAA